MLPEVSEIKVRRNRLGIKQSDLARAAGVSQSLIAKLESGKIEASYNRVKKIFQALDEIENKMIKEEKICEEVMSKKVVSINPESTIKRAAELMKKHSFSQLPVIKNGKNIGVITESDIAFLDMDKSKVRVKDIMKESLPIVNKQTSVRVIKPLLINNPAGSCFR